MRGLFYFLGVIALLVYLAPKAGRVMDSERQRQREYAAQRRATHEARCAYLYAKRSAPRAPLSAVENFYLECP